MLNSREGLRYYLTKDKEKLGRKTKKPSFGDEIWKFQIAGKIKITDGVAIGANSVVTKSCKEKM